MSMFLFAFVTCAAFVIFCFRAKSPASGLTTPAASAALAALAITLLIVISVGWPLKHRGDAVIAWTGVESRNEQLSVGEPALQKENGAEETIAWPNGLSGPFLHATCGKSDVCKLDMDGANGFIQYSLPGGDKQILNADALYRYRPLKVNGFAVALVSGAVTIPLVHFEIETGWVHPRLRIDTPGGQTIYSERLGREVRPETMTSLLSTPMAELRRDSWVPGQSELAKVAMDLERWARDLNVFPAHVGPLGTNLVFISSLKPRSEDVKLPASIDVLWPGRTLHTALERSTEGRLSLKFGGPWQSSSPVPPEELGHGGEVILTVSGQAHPGEVAFVLPLGNSTRREAVAIRDGRLSQTRKEGGKPATREPLPEDLLNRQRAPEAPVNLLPDSGSTSSAAIAVGSESAVLETIPIQPRFWLLLAGILAAWVTFAYALDSTLREPNRARYQQIQGIRLEDRKTLAALSVVLWTFLLLRLGLAVRYSWDSAHLDSVVVQGVDWALFGLAVIPPFALRSAMMWLVQVQDPNPDDGRRMRKLTAMFLTVGALEIALVEHGFWPGLLPQFRHGAGFWVLFLIFLAIVFLWTWVRINHEYTWDEETSSSGGKLAEQIHRFVLDFSTRYAQFARSMNVPLWKRTYSSQLPGKQFWRTYAVFTSCMLVFLAIYGLLYWLGHMIWPGVEPLKEVIAPALLCLPPICFLLNSRLAYPAGSTSAATEKPDFWRVAAQVAALVILLSVVYPLLLGDPGALVVTAALFLPTAIILLMGGAPWRIAALTGAFLVSGLVGVALLALQFKPALQAASALGEMKLRVMEFADSSSVEKGILFGRIARPNSFSLQPPLSATRMRQTHQHLWEMEAIARIGGYAGLGFGAAPVRKSQVRQDTLQYDSTFSFFVVSEHGLLGGVLLIGLYSLPLLIIVASARRKLDVGHALALIIASSFFLEATSHALMNLGALPETGRSMPLLAVKSISDLLRWLIFFRIAAQALMWRINSADAGYSKDPALLSDHPPQSRTPVRYSVTSVAWGAGVAIALVIVTLADSKLIHDPRLKELNWKGLLEATDSHIRQQDFVLSKGRIEPSPAIKRSGDLLFLQEMARFNELTDAEKITGLPRDEEEQFCREARDVRSVAGYNALMTQLRNADRPFHSRVAPSLFVLQRSRDDWGGDDSAEEDTEESVDAAPADPCILGPDLALKIRANGQFVSISRFEERVQAAPAVYVGSPPIPVIGTAWVDGRTIGVVNPDANIPWLSYLRTGIESGDYSPPADQSGRVTLTLDIALQQAAQEFLPRMATPWHDELLKGVKPSTRKGQTAAWEPSGIEPPRAALTILNMKNGEVLALGGFPRMAPGQAWQGGAEGEELIPPAQWVESRAPQSLQVRYGGDRNFDRLLMGSSTKPLWATAAVNVHPSLDSKLGVTGHSGSEKEIFGIPVTQKKGWEIDQVSSGLNGGWCDFRSYLAISDNRYHVRLGFLSLAEWNGDSPREGTDRKPTGDDARETIDLSTPWTKYPVFPAELMFSPDQPRRLAHVDAQPLAIQMQKIFGVQIKDANESFVRSSFWTGDEQDDNRMAPLGAAMYGASPQRVNLALDKISSPRDFVTVLLGGGANRWANVDFAGAFASAVLGSPVIPHIVRLSKAPASGRIRTVEEARKVRRGLSAAYSDSHGTVWKQFGAEAPAVQKFLEAHSGYRIYAKTGTLPAGKGVPNTSRLVLAMVKWEGDESVLKSGIVFSMVIDRGSTGLAAKWLGQFITTYQKEIAAALGD